MDALNTVVNGISAQHSLATLKEQKVPVPAKLLMVITVGIFAGIYYLYRHIQSENQVRLFAKFASIIANAEDLTRAKELRVVTDDNGEFTLTSVILDGEPRIRVNHKNVIAPLYLDKEITTIKQVQDRVRVDILEDRETYEKLGVTYNENDVRSEAAFEQSMLNRHIDTLPAPRLDNHEICRENIISSEIQHGGFASQVTKLGYKNGAIYFFKPSLNSTYRSNTSLAACVSGISVANERPHYRSMFTHAIAQYLNFDVIPETVQTKNHQGIPGYAQKKASGQSCWDLLLQFAQRNSFDVLQSNPIIVRKIIELQLLDALTGQVDRHANNYFIDIENNQVHGIDNDACGGALITHPHNMIAASKSDGYGRYGARLTKHEKRVLTHLRMQGLYDPQSMLKNNGSGGRAVLLPPVMDTDMVDKFKRLDNQTLLSYMEPFHFTQNEKRAACFRLDAIKTHIQILEQRQKAGNPSIISPNQWNSQEVKDKLFHSNKGNNLVVATSYLQRDINFVSAHVV